MNPTSQPAKIAPPKGIRFMAINIPNDNLSSDSRQTPTTFPIIGCMPAIRGCCPNERQLQMSKTFVGERRIRRGVVVGTGFEPVKA